MPEIYVHAVKGRSLDQKRALIKDITDAVVKNFNATPDAVVVTIIEAEPRPVLRIELRYDPQRRPVIGGIKRVSRPSLRVYVGSKDIPAVRGGLGVSVLSTPKGLLVDRDARRENVGGELLCTVW